ncbi:MAG: tRNA guanosine(15) transglycosylase TgtA [Candidatus Bathyarchaeia archaeon]
MSFEVKDRDLLARIGKLRTKSGAVETPLLFPVVNPAVQPISPKRIREEFGFEALITNAYILKKRFKMEPAERGLHKFLDFNGVVMTDSGAYQILVYGDVETTSEEIVAYQEQIDTDIATILDWPTGWKATRRHAEQTVEETLKRARELFQIRTREDILWVGPVQGGRYLDLVAKSASEMGKLPFHIHALGSPTEVMENYRFDVLVDMILTAKMNLPIERPLHLFGAGHPFMFALAVALGCDLFDSAAYAIYAKEGRYMTETGTVRLEELEYFPCACPKCSSKTPKEISEMPPKERQVFLAEHNLYACLSEIRRVKQAIREGRLWEHLELRSHGHPTLLQALKRLKIYEEFIEKHSPTVKPSGLFFFSSLGLSRPEVVRHRVRLSERFTHYEREALILMPQTKTKPFHRSKLYKKLGKALRNTLRMEDTAKIQVCFYEAPFGLVPIELDEVYPLSQHETALPPDLETIEYVAAQVVNHISQQNYKIVAFLNNHEVWGEKVLKACRDACQNKGVIFTSFDIEMEEWPGLVADFLKQNLEKQRRGRSAD